MRKSTLGSLIGLIALTLVVGCSIIEGIDRQRHEQDSTHVYFDGTAKQVGAASRKAMEKLGYVVDETDDGISEGKVSGPDFHLTYKEAGQGKVSLYVRCGFTGDKDKESRIIEEIKKFLTTK